MMNRLSFLVLSVLLHGCIANDSLRTSAMAENSIHNLSRVSVGMNQADVLCIMRHPYRKETFTMDKSIFDVWFYVTSPTVLGQSRMVPQNLTPLAFMNGKLIGWGHSYYRYLVKRQNSDQQPTIEKAPATPTEDINLEKALQPTFEQQKTPPPAAPAPSKAQPAQPGQAPAPSSGKPNWGPVAPPAKNQPPQQKKGQPPAASPQGQPQGQLPGKPTSPPPAPPPASVSAASKPQKPPATTPPPAPVEQKKKIPLTEEDEEMLDKESEQDFNQT